MFAHVLSTVDALVNVVLRDFGSGIFHLSLEFAQEVQYMN